MSDKKWFRVSLRFSGDTLPIDEIEAQLGLEPGSIGRKGEALSDHPRSARYHTNLWVHAFTKDRTVSFEEQIGDLLDWLESRREYLEELLATPGHEGELFLGFSSESGQGGASFSPFLLERISSFGLTLGLDLYPPHMMSKAEMKSPLPLERDSAPSEVSLEEFIRTGFLGEVAVGIDRAAVEESWGLPESWTVSEGGIQQADRWTYGQIECSFDEGILQHISIDEIGKTFGGRSVLIDSDIVTNCLTVSQIEEQLDLADIPFERSNPPRQPRAIRLETPGGTSLFFDLEYDDDEEPVLRRIWNRLKP